MRIGNRKIVGSPWDAGKPRRYTQTDIEQLLARILDTFGGENTFWVKQFRLPGIDLAFSGHKFDFAVPSRKLVIEADGCRWHGCKRCYPTSKPRVRDHLINCAVEAAGWRIVRYWGHSIKGQPTDVRQHLEKILAEFS